MNQIRELNPFSHDEISLVASRMLQTLVEVLGEERGVALHTMDWLVDRVRWHLDAKQTNGKVFLIVSATGEIKGHAIARIEYDEDKSAFGYFSTIFVEPNSRNKGLANALVGHVEAWLRNMGMSKIIYNTAENHSKLIRLFERQGIKITHQESEMVQLTKAL